MKIIEITVSWGETQSLPEYCNVKPSITLKASVDEDDNPAVLERNLWEWAQASVRAQIDNALELHDRPARYDPVPRFQVLRSVQQTGFGRKSAERRPKIILILPDTHNERLAGYTHALYPESRKLRYAYALVKAQDLAAQDEAQLIDCSDGDLTKIPAMPEEHPF